MLAKALRRFVVWGESFYVVPVEVVMVIVQKALISLNVLDLVGSNSSQDVAERVRVVASMPDADCATESG